MENKEVKASYTPGPWKQKTGPRLSGSGWARIIDIKTEGPIANVSSRHTKGNRERGDFDTEEANARLIAAAPELLKACQETLTRLINTEINGTLADAVIGNQDKGRIQSSICILGTAIAKAEGRE